MSTYKSILEPATMRYAKPLASPQAAFCEQIINIGLFFDGTENNHTAEDLRIHPKVRNCRRSRIARRPRHLPRAEPA